MEKKYFYLELIMPVGFGKSSNNTSSIIKSLKKSFLVNQEQLQNLRQEWDADYPYRIHEPFSEEDLFKPREYSYEGPRDLTKKFWNPSSPSYASRQKMHVREMIGLGYWNLMVTQDLRGQKSRYYQEWDFTITVRHGNCNAFHPLEAKNNILKFHTKAVYKKWKKVVNEDLERFKDVLNAYNPTSSIFSATCSDSSERVCRRLGLEISDGFAFLVHDKNKVCQHKSGTYKVVN